MVDLSYDMEKYLRESIQARGVWRGADWRSQRVRRASKIPGRFLSWAAWWGSIVMIGSSLGYLLAGLL